MDAGKVSLCDKNETKDMVVAVDSDITIEAHHDNKTKQPALQYLMAALSADASHVKYVFKDFLESYTVCDSYFL